MCLANSATARREARAFGARIEAAEVPPPLFILGHWRSGTTHLHNLLALDPRFAFPTLLQALNPLTFLLTEARMAPIAGFVAMRRRPQDDVALGVDLPTEDEFALCTMTGLSPYMGWAFPRGGHDYRSYLTFRRAAEGDAGRWKAALTLFLKKLTFKHGRPLVLKSPPHTARIGLILQAFPEARFVHIHRDPFAVFRSTRHLHRAVAPYFRFQRGGCFDAEDRITATYTEIYDAFFEEKGCIPPGRFSEVGFEDLEREPVAAVRSIYDGLGLPGFDELRPRLEGYLGTLAGYRKNRPEELSSATRRRLSLPWSRSFDAWGYEC